MVKPPMFRNVSNFHKLGAVSLLKKMPNVNDPILKSVAMLKPRSEIGGKGMSNYNFYLLAYD